MCTVLIASSPVTVTVSPTSETLIGAAKAVVGRPNTATSASTSPGPKKRFSAEREARE
jgi:hypothetical protein